MNQLSKSQKFMIYAFILLLIAQFFSYGTSSYLYQTTGGGFTLTNSASYDYTGWDIHPWWIAVVIAGGVYWFYSRKPQSGWYWAALIFMIIYGMGSFLGFISMILAGYAIYRKRKEDKQSGTPASPSENISN